MSMASHTNQKRYLWVGEQPQASPENRSCLLVRFPLAAAIRTNNNAQDTVAMPAEFTSAPV